MVAVYAIATVLGVLGLITWVGLGMFASAVPDKRTLDPELRFGGMGRAVVAGLAGFGLGGMSASYGGATTILALIGAIAGAIVMVIAARYLGFDTDTESAAGSGGDSA